MKVSISKCALGSEMERNLHSALQGNFKEWLNYKGYTKNLNDLVKMLDKKWWNLIFMLFGSFYQIDELIWYLYPALLINKVFKFYLIFIEKGWVK